MNLTTKKKHLGFIFCIIFTYLKFPWICIRINIAGKLCSSQVVLPMVTTGEFTLLHYFRCSKTLCCHRRLNSHNKSINYTKGKIMRLKIPESNIRSLLLKGLPKRCFRRQRQHTFINFELWRYLHVCLKRTWTKRRFSLLMRRNWIRYLAFLPSLRKGIWSCFLLEVYVFLRSLNVPLDVRHFLGSFVSSLYGFSDVNQIRDCIIGIKWNNSTRNNENKNFH